jgi:predicted dinucleotide-binding enzyme
MTHISIIGTGNMGQAISGIVTNGGNTVELFDQADADKAVTGDIVVLAVPYPAVATVLAQRADQLAGKIVVDITNPLNFETFDSLTVPADGSAAAEIAEALPQSRMLKALNTQLPTTVLIAGDDAEAKALLAGVSYRWWLCAPSTPARLGGPSVSSPRLPSTAGTQGLPRPPCSRRRRRGSRSR